MNPPSRQVLWLLASLVPALGYGDGWKELQVGKNVEFERAGFEPEPAPPTIVVVHTVLQDNGDNDERADTNETVEMRLALYNRMGFDVTGLVVRLSTEDARVACISKPTVTIDHIATRGRSLTEDAFRFLVSDMSRASVSENFSVRFRVEMEADQFAELPSPQWITLDLDLDIAGGGETTSYFESFEGGFGGFTTMHLDQDLNPPASDLNNHEAGLQASDGFRCRYNDPDVFQERQWCHLTAYGGPDAYYFYITADRAHSGAQSLHFGIPLDGALGFTTPNALLQAVRTAWPINLGWRSVCSVSDLVECQLDEDCPIGESCRSVNPGLSIKHQISQLDHRITGADGGGQRAVVQVQLVDEAGLSVSPWENLQPYYNAYDTQDTFFWNNCSFDPIDDGNNEDDVDPGVGLFGPSSTCYPERTFIHQGATDIYDVNEIGDASDGPGLEGTSGPGTWVESVFDLRRYRGRRVHLRFLESTVEVTSVANVQEGWALNPSPLDDGWFIDDVNITGVLTNPAIVTVDTNDNLDIKEDFDLDNVGALCDCNSDDETAWDFPGPVADLRLDREGGGAGTATLSWSEPSFLGGTAVAYDTLRTPAPSDFGAAATCIESDDGSDTIAVDTESSGSGMLRAYLVRARHSCGAGSPGVTSAGEQRVVRECP